MWCSDQLTLLYTVRLNTNIIAVCLCLLIKISYWPLKLSHLGYSHLVQHLSFDSFTVCVKSSWFWTVICVCASEDHCWVLMLTVKISGSSYPLIMSKYECYWWWLCVFRAVMWCEWWWQLPVCLSLPVLRPQRNHSWPWKVRKAACFDPVPSNISTVIDLSAADVTHVFLHCAVFPLEGDVHWIITSSLLDHAGHIHSYFPFTGIQGVRLSWHLDGLDSLILES